MSNSSRKLERRDFKAEGKSIEDIRQELQLLIKLVPKLREKHGLGFSLKFYLFLFHFISGFYDHAAFFDGKEIQDKIDQTHKDYLKIIMGSGERYMLSIADADNELWFLFLFECMMEFGR